MKRAVTWSHGILMVLGGIVVALVGTMLAAMQMRRDVWDWAIAFVGGVLIVGGVILASRAKIDRSLPANERRIPSARIHRSARR